MLREQYARQSIDMDESTMLRMFDFLTISAFKANISTTTGTSPESLVRLSGSLTSMSKNGRSVWLSIQQGYFFATNTK